MSTIWQEVGGKTVAQLIKGNAFRLVECQETVATTEIVSNLERQSVLEEMIENSKPSNLTDTEALHYLLSTPFRYPPLNHGSRFGGRFEPSLFYGGNTEEVTLSEAAFYRFFFFYDMETPPPTGLVKSQHTLFEFLYKTSNGVKLQDPPFDLYNDKIRDPISYSDTQALGAAMRGDGIKGFEYPAARESNGGINVALYDHTSLACEKPINQHRCLSQVSETEVVFSLHLQTVKFNVNNFMVHSNFPNPSD